AQHVEEEFPEELQAGGLIAAVLDGGQSEVGIESTILDLSRLETHGPVLLRPGHITANQISDVLGMPLSSPDATAPRASGTLDAHYAPLTPVVLVNGDELDTIVRQLQGRARKIALMSYQAHPSIHMQAWRQLPDDPVGYAHDLYAGLRELDHAHADLILVEALPQGKNWQGVNDRLRRAAFDSRGILQKMLTA
ncbi:MAG: translation factor Sua5, partial [Burkholderiales bacterium]|nr:translation factor Sua5 [Burkholderiales bacterium]